MKASTPALLLYSVASVLAVVGVALDLELLTLLTKPIIVPAIYFFYIQFCNHKPNILVTVALFCSFSADMLVLIKLPDGDIPIAALNISMYIIFIHFILNDLKQQFIPLRRYLYLLVIVILCLFILSIILDLMKGLDAFTFSVYVFYGVVLSILSALIGFNHLNKASAKSFYAFLMCICFIISDIFYAIYNFYLEVSIFVILNVAAQFVSYYYIVVYFITREDLLPKNSDNEK